MALIGGDEEELALGAAAKGQYGRRRAITHPPGAPHHHCHAYRNPDPESKNYR